MGNSLFIWVAEAVPFLTALAAFLYGVCHFFKKGKALYLQSITMAMGSHALGSLYRICQLMTRGSVGEGFTPAYLGRIGFFLFFLTAGYGQIDRIVDDGSPALKFSRRISFLAPALLCLLYLPNLMIDGISTAKQISYLLVWIPAVITVYFNMKHALIPDQDFGFVKAIKPYNLFALALGFVDLICLSIRGYYNNIPYVVVSLIFGVLCIATLYAAKKGVEKWTI